MEEILLKLREQDAKIEAIWKSVEKTRKYFMWTLIITLVTIVIPFIGLIFIIPTFLKTFSYSNLGL
jgi:type II secretory pathway component PulF